MEKPGSGSGSQADEGSGRGTSGAPGSASVSSFVVEPTAAGQRVDLFVGKQLSLSRAKLKALFEAGSVRVNGLRVKKGVALAEGQRVEVEISQEGPRAPVPQPELPLVVLREAGALIFIDK